MMNDIFLEKAKTNNSEFSYYSLPKVADEYGFD